MSRLDSTSMKSGRGSGELSTRRASYKTLTVQFPRLYGIPGFLKVRLCAWPLRSIADSHRACAMPRSPYASDLDSGAAPCCPLRGGNCIHAVVSVEPVEGAATAACKQGRCKAAGLRGSRVAGGFAQRGLLSCLGASASSTASSVRTAEPGTTSKLTASFPPG